MSNSAPGPSDNKNRDMKPRSSKPLPSEILVSNPLLWDICQDLDITTTRKPWEKVNQLDHIWSILPQSYNKEKDLDISQEPPSGQVLRIFGGVDSETKRFVCLIDESQANALMRRSGHPLGFIDRLAAPSYPNRWSRLLSLTPITVTSSMNLFELIPDNAPVKNLKKKKKLHRDTEPNSLTIEKLLFEQNRMLYRLIAPSQSFHRKLLANALGIPLALIRPFVQICAVTFDEPRVIVKSWEQRIQSPRVAGFGWAETNMKCPLEFDAQRSLYMTPKESMLAPVGPERTETKVQPLSSIKEFFASKLCDNQAPNPTLLLTYHKVKVLKVFETWGMDVLWKHDFNDLLLPLLTSESKRKRSRSPVRNTILSKSGRGKKEEPSDLWIRPDTEDKKPLPRSRYNIKSEIDTEDQKPLPQTRYNVKSEIDTEDQKPPPVQSRYIVKSEIDTEDQKPFPPSLNGPSPSSSAVPLERKHRPDELFDRKRDYPNLNQPLRNPESFSMRFPSKGIYVVDIEDLLFLVLPAKPGNPHFDSVEDMAKVLHVDASSNSAETLLKIWELVVVGPDIIAAKNGRFGAVSYVELSDPRQGGGLDENGQEQHSGFAQARLQRNRGNGKNPFEMDSDSDGNGGPSSDEDSD